MKIRTSEEHPHLGGNAIGGDPNTFCPDLWQWLIDKYNIKTVFDVGCGEGHALKKFKELGCEVFGIDGLQENVDCCDGLAQMHDITLGPFTLISRVDLVWCCELVEHISEKYLFSLLDTLAQGKYLVMTHAIPGQHGYHHVNCRDDQYWINMGRLMNYSYLSRDTMESRDLFPTTYWKQSGLIFKSMFDKMILI